MRRVLVLAGVIGLLVALAVPAHAAKPEVTGEFEFEFTGPDGFLTDVCGFDVFVSNSVRGIEKMYFDKDGEPVRQTLKIRGTSIYSNGDETLPPEHWAWNGTFSFEDETFMERGVFWNLHDGGPILMEKGRVLFPEGDGPPIQVSGQFPLMEEGGFDPLCEALAP